jgi:6-pyruvoyltetrahydropterin/6-carboxytetrahydropterin synthase
MATLENQTIRVTKTFSFDMAHALFGYDGPCKNIHGHTYSLSITLKGKVNQSSNHPKNGMVIDFSDFKKIVTDNIISVYDHTLVLNKNSPHAHIEGLNENFERIKYVPFQPSCENLMLEFLALINSKFPSDIAICKLKLEETPTSYSEWVLEDNL